MQRRPGRRPVGGARQVAAANRLFGGPAVPGIDTDDPGLLLEFAARTGERIGWEPGRTDFRSDRLNREAREAAGLDLSKRQYNRRFRVLRRIAAVLLDRCGSASGWWMIAQVRATPDVLERLGEEERGRLLDVACPGKAMRLMAADLAWWHRGTGGDVDPDTRVWASLLRRAGAFSGKHVRPDLAGPAAHGLASGVVVSELPGGDPPA
ncbi:hypothetical protein FHR32_005316 [Streptosporangium album]|uniref:Uncharacterized protein n=1 Tax=Streptosporangium album TaxID=47479 RepID=A0A7W7RZ70_9ACTN|nr:hypothetical protein [Streptosporangium album]MBB4940939.1 hypothetical protein [Streptosporangium album]